MKKVFFMSFLVFLFSVNVSAEINSCELYSPGGNYPPINVHQDLEISDNADDLIHLCPDKIVYLKSNQIYHLHSFGRNNDNEASKEYSCEYWNKRTTPGFGLVLLECSGTK